MIHTLFRSEDFPLWERFDQWCAVTARELQPTRLSTQHLADFHGSIRVVTLGAINLAEIAYSPLICYRDPVHVRRDDPQDLQIHLILRGTAVMDFDRRQESASAGEMLVNGSWHPYIGRAAAPAGMVKHLTLNVPRQSLAVPRRWTDRILGRRLSAAGSGAILASLLKDTLSAAGQNTDLRPQEAACVGNAALCLVSAIIAHHADTEAALPPETRNQVLIQHIRAFIDAHLADAALSPQLVADAHHLSLRHLHRLFQQDDATVGAWIRHRRLEHCRHDLADLRLVARPIRAIAAHWGFAQPADFTRAFRTAYGTTPSDYRAARLQPRDGTVR
jgi:AraC-like DNA-binding protein